MSEFITGQIASKSLFDEKMIESNWRGKRVKHILLASQSDAHRIALHRDPIQPNPRPRPRPIHPLIDLKQERPMM